MAQQATYILRVVDLFTSPVKRIIQTTKAMTRQFNVASTSLKKLGYHFTSLRNIISATYGAAMIAFPIKQAMDFEAAMIDVKRVIDFATPQDFEKFAVVIDEISAKLGVLPLDIGKIAYEGAKLNDTATDLERFVRLAANASVAFDMGGKEAGEMLGIIKSRLGLTIDATKDYLDATNFLADRFETTGKRIIHTTSRMVSELKAYKMPPRLVASWAAFADSISTTPRLAASGIKLMTREMGMSRRWSRKMIKDADGAMKELLQKYAGMKLSRRIRLINRRFSKAAGDFIKRAAASMGQFKKAFELTAGGRYVDSMMIELEKKLKSTETAVGRLKVVWNMLGREIGNVMLPIIKEVAPVMVRMAISVKDFAKAHPGLVKAAMAFIGIATALSAITVVIGLVSIAIGTLISPVTLVILGIMAVVGAFAYFYAKSEMVRNALTTLKNSIITLFAPLARVLDKIFGGIEGDTIFTILEYAITGLVYVIAGLFDAISMPVRIVFNLLDQVINKFDDIKNHGVFGFIFKAIGASFGDIGASFTTTAASEAAINAGNNAKIDGWITVAAEKGTEVKSAGMDSDGFGNVGFNMMDY